MPRKRETERVIIVRTDINGNVLDYEVVDPSTRSTVTQRPSQIYRTHQIEQSPKVSRTETYDNEENEYEDVPRREIYQDSTAGTKSTTRRVRYIRPKSTVKIFEEKVDWNADQKVDTHNDEAMKKIRRKPTKKVFDEKLSWSGKTKIDTHNEEVIDSIRRRPKSAKIFTETPIWYAESKIDTHNEEVVKNIRRTPKYRVYSERLTWNAASSKIDSHNEEVIDHLKSVPRPTIYDEKLTWLTPATINTQNQEYIQHKQREHALRKQKIRTRVQSFPQVRTVRADRPRIDHHNADFIEYKKRKKLSRLPPIEDRKFEWEKRSRINQRNDAYIERIEQKRSKPLIFREKVRWNTKTSRIDNHNEEYLDNLKGHRRPKIINELPHWNSQPKIDTYNDSYTQNSDSHPKPLIVDEKVRWHARSKIDTGLQSDPHEDEFVDYGLTSDQ